jgi:trimethylamine---corrinoid protein Co-methyltransferase
MRKKSLGTEHILPGPTPQDFPYVTEETVHIKPRQRFLSDRQMRRLHEAALQILETTGVRVTHEKAREIIQGHGGEVEGDRVRLPAWLVEQALGLVPPQVVFYSRRGKKAVVLKDDDTYYGPTLDAFDYLSPITGERGPFTVDDCRVTATIADALDHFHWVMTIGVASDIASSVAERTIARQALTYTEKPLLFCCSSLKAMKDIYQMAATIAGGEAALLMHPNIVVFNSPISPLVFNDALIDRLLFAAEKGIPQVCYSGPQAGATAPATLAGTVVQGSVESLFGIVLAQMVRPASPFIYGAFATIMDMKTSVFSYGAPEMNVMASAMAQMAQFYNIPFMGMSGCSDAKRPDQQAAVEATFSCLCSSMSGANMVHDNGWLDRATLVSPEYMVLVNEIIEMVNHYMAGMRVDDDRLALDILDKVGPGGNFLNEPHTFKYFREVWYSKLFDRSTAANWEKQGGKEFHQRLNERTRALMDHTPEPLPDEVVKDLDRMAAEWQ